MRLFALLLLLSAPAWTQDLSVVEDGSGKKIFTNLPADCFEGDVRQGSSRCVSAPDTPAPTSNAASKSAVSEIASELEQAERALAKATAERDRARRAYDGIREQIRINPKDEGARRMVAVYSSRLSIKNQEVSKLQQRLSFLRLRSILHPE